MNTLQKATAAFFAAAIAWMMLFPPFACDLGGGANINLGYAFVLRPPNLGGENPIVANVNSVQLLVQVLGATAVGMFLVSAGKHGQPH